MDKNTAAKFSSPVELTMAILGGKYKSSIIWYLNEQKTMRYNEIQKAIPHATAKMLSQQLKELTQDNIILRKLYPVVPPKTEYSLTKFGKSIVPVVSKMCDWGESYLKELGLPSPCDTNE